MRNSIRKCPPNYSKALPPDPPVPSYSRQSSSIYSQATGTYSLYLPLPLAPKNSSLSAPSSETSRQLLSALLPNPSLQGLSTTTNPVLLHEHGNKAVCNQYPNPVSRQLQRPLAPGPFENTYRVHSPLLIETEPCAPMTTQDDHVYVEPWPTDSVLALVGARLEGPFDPKIPHKGFHGSCPSSSSSGFAGNVPQSRNHALSTKGVTLDVDTEEEIASALCSLYQSYFTETHEVKAISPRNRLGGGSPEHQNDSDRSSRLAPAPSSLADLRQELHSAGPGDRHCFPTGRGLTVAAPATGVSIEKKKPTPLYRRDGRACVSLQADLLDQACYGKRVKTWPETRPFIRYRSCLAGFEDDVLPEVSPRAFSTALLGSPPHTNISLIKRRNRVRIVGRTRPRKANVSVQEVPRSLPGVPKGLSSALEGYASHSIGTRPGTLGRTSLNSEYSKLPVLNTPSVERRPATVPGSSNPCATARSLHVEIEHTYNPYGNYKSRFSIDSLEPTVIPKSYAL